MLKKVWDLLLEYFISRGKNKRFDKKNKSSAYRFTKGGMLHLKR
jgi:hypothetical protein